jgi:hypothetical protein
LETWKRQSVENAARVFESDKRQAQQRRTTNMVQKLAVVRPDQV